MLGLGRLGKAGRRVDLQIELEADDLVEGHALEERPPGLHQVLLLGATGQVDLVGPRLDGLSRALDAAEGVEVAPAIGEGDEVSVEARPSELLELEPVTRDAAQEIDVGQEKKLAVAGT